LKPNIIWVNEGCLLFYLSDKFWLLAAFNSICYAALWCSCRLVTLARKDSSMYILFHILTMMLAGWKRWTSITTVVS